MQPLGSPKTRMATDQYLLWGKVGGGKLRKSRVPKSLKIIPNHVIWSLRVILRHISDFVEFTPLVTILVYLQELKVAAFCSALRKLPLLMFRALLDALFRSCGEVGPKSRA